MDGHAEYRGIDHEIVGRSFGIEEFVEPSSVEQSPRAEWPDWVGPPANYTPADVPLEVTIGRGEGAVIRMVAVKAYPVGWAFELVVTLDEPLPRDVWESMFFPFVEQPSASDGHRLPAPLLRFGFAFADGSKATSVDELDHDVMLAKPPGPVLQSGGVSGSGSGSDFGLTMPVWCWPLPPAGIVTAVCEWPTYGIEQTYIDFEGEGIRQAGERATRTGPDPLPYEVPDLGEWN